MILYRLKLSGVCGNLDQSDSVPVIMDDEELAYSSTLSMPLCECDGALSVALLRIASANNVCQLSRSPGRFCVRMNGHTVFLSRGGLPHNGILVPTNFGFEESLVSM